LGDLVIPAGEDQLLEKTAEAGDRILEDFLKMITGSPL
jgi:hypothetical protein